MTITCIYDNSRVTIETNGTNLSEALTTVLDALSNDPESVTVYCIDGFAQFSGTYKAMLDSNINNNLSMN